MQWWLNNNLNGRWLLHWEQWTSSWCSCSCIQMGKSLHETPRWQSQRMEENLKKLDSFDQKLQEVQQCSQHLEEEWEKGEKEWREYLIKLERIEKDWEDFVKSQQTQWEFLTLGISFHILESEINWATITNQWQIALIEGLKKNSTDLSRQIEKLTVTVGAAGGASTGVFIGSAGGPLGSALGALIGGGVGLWLFFVCYSSCTVVDTISEYSHFLSIQLIFLPLHPKFLHGWL